MGGLVGVSYAAISNCYAIATVTGTGTGTGNAVVLAGGLVGSNGGTISNCYATGNVTGTGRGDVVNVGGLAGWNVSSGDISNSYATGKVSGRGTEVGSSSVSEGGFVGENNGSISNSYFNSGNRRANSWYRGNRYSSNKRPRMLLPPFFKHSRLPLHGMHLIGILATPASTQPYGVTKKVVDLKSKATYFAGN